MSIINKSICLRIPYKNLNCYCKSPSPPNNNYPFFSFLFLFAYTCDNIDRLERKIDKIYYK